MTVTHRMSSTSLYSTWASMVSRCCNSNVRHYHRYGGRGIKVCERWHRFENFRDDITTELGERPAGLTLDRIDNDGNYEPGNVRWSSQREQLLNSSAARRLTAFGVTGSFAEMIQRFSPPGINRVRVSGRLRYGWSVERALTEPPHRTGSRA